LFAEIDPRALLGSVAPYHGHALQPRDSIAQVSVDLDMAFGARLVEAPD
jgi:hypothetical protein